MLTMNLWFNCSLKDWTCDCQKPRVTGKVCPHLYAAATKAGLQIHNYMHKQDTRIGYKAQYAFEYPATPSQAEINERALLQCVETAYLPPKVGCGKGRPKELVRRKGPVEKAKKKRKKKKRAAEGKGAPTLPTCQRCFRIGHTIRNCPNPPSPKPPGGSASRKRPAASSVGASSDKAAQTAKKPRGAASPDPHSANRKRERNTSD